MVAPKRLGSQKCFYSGTKNAPGLPTVKLQSVRLRTPKDPFQQAMSIPQRAIKIFYLLRTKTRLSHDTHTGYQRFNLEAAIERGILGYLDFPNDLNGKYQSYTCANMKKLSQRGIEIPATTIENGILKYYQLLANFYKKK